MVSASVGWGLVGLVALAWAFDVEASDIEALIDSRGANYQSTPCWFDLAHEQIDDRRTSCGMFAVPEHWDKPDSRQIHLPLVTFHAKDAASDASPVIFINGGPGSRANISDGTVIGQYWLPFLRQQPWSERRDFIVLALRGTNWSDSNLDCPELHDPSQLGASSEAGKTNPSPSLGLESMTACLERLANDHDLGGYNLKQQALDIAALRPAMAIDSWSLLGVSYGTRLALMTLRDHPDGIENLVLDSVTPIDLDPLGSVASSFEAVLDQVFQACRDDRVCDRYYPDSRAQLARILERAAKEKLEIKIEDHPLHGTIYLPLTPSSLAQSLLVITLNSWMIGYIPFYIDALDRAYGEAFVGWLFGLSLDFFSQQVLGANLVQSCNDDFDDITDIDPSVMEGGDLISTDWIFDSLSLADALCERFAKAPLPSDHFDAVVSDIPTLLLSGSFDVVTPPSGAAEAATSLSRAHHVTFRDRSHAVLFGSFGDAGIEPDCPTKIVTAFLKAPENEPDDPCLKVPGTIKLHLPE